MLFKITYSNDSLVAILTHIISAKIKHEITKNLFYYHLLYCIRNNARIVGVNQCVFKNFSDFNFRTVTKLTFFSQSAAAGGASAGGVQVQLEHQQHQQVLQEQQQQCQLQLRWLRQQ